MDESLTSKPALAIWWKASRPVLLPARYPTTCSRWSAMIAAECWLEPGTRRSGCQDSTGLAFDFDVPATCAGNDVLALVERGGLSGTSFGFMFHEDGETWEGNKRTLRTIDLREISVV